MLNLNQRIANLLVDIPVQQVVLVKNWRKTIQLVAFIMNQQNLTLLRNRRRLTSLIVGMLCLITAVPVYAEFKPKNRKPASGHSRGGGSRGSRGCPGEVGIPLTVLAPQTFIGKTASVRPTLTWYMPSTENVQFRIFEFESDIKLKQIGKVKKISAKIGINTLKLPADYPELEVGKTYLWQIEIDCGNEIIVKPAELTVINSPKLPVTKKITNIPEKVDYYAANELWYEALEEALKATNNGQLGQSGSILVQELAQSEMLTGTKTEIPNIKQRIENLQKISGVSKPVPKL